MRAVLGREKRNGRMAADEVSMKTDLWKGSQQHQRQSERITKSSMKTVCAQNIMQGMLTSALH